MLERLDDVIGVGSMKLSKDEVDRKSIVAW